MKKRTEASTNAPSPDNDVETIRSELKVMEGLCSCGHDDKCVWEAQEALDRIAKRLAAKTPEKLEDFLSRIEPKLIAQMKFMGDVWDMANTETKIHMLLEDILFCHRHSNHHAATFPKGIEK